jgi:hemin uptake protein HemP
MRMRTIIIRYDVFCTQILDHPKGARMRTPVNAKSITSTTNAMGDDPAAPKALASLPSNHAVPCVRSSDLFGSSNEIEIEHGGSRYRLRKTLLGKLIMTK